MAARPDPGREMNVLSYVTLVCDQRRARVQPHAQADGPGVEALIDASCRLQGSPCRGKRDEEGVALRVHLDPALLCASLPHDAAVLGQRFGVRLCTQPVQESRRPFDVGEEEGDRADREVLSHSAIIRRAGTRVQSATGSGYRIVGGASVLSPDLAAHPPCTSSPRNRSACWAWNPPGKSWAKVFGRRSIARSTKAPSPGPFK
jgi:hypothetical protein